MNLKIAKNPDELNLQVANWIVEYINQVLQKTNAFHFVLSGGNTPKKLYQLLSSKELRDKIDWRKLHFYWGDERCVPFTDERNNAKMAFENLLDHVPIHKDQVHIMRTDIEPYEAAIGYQKLLHKKFPGKNHTFDLVLLGMGDDAHTLSLFPGSDVINEKNDWVKAVYSGEQKMYRITLTPPVINASARVAFLINGSSKAASLYHVLSEEYDPMFYPSQIIQPFNDELYWWVDEAAAADIQ